MSKNEIKKISNLTVKIGKAMDIITSCDFSKIKFNLFLFQQIDNELTIQIKKYARFADYELDFTVNDISDLSNAIYEFIKNYQQKFLYSKYKKHFANIPIITGEMFDKFTSEIAEQMQVDTVLREVYKSLSYKALLYDIWSASSDKKSFSDQITDLLRTFL